jgi:hypothetical protein
MHLIPKHHWIVLGMETCVWTYEKYYVPQVAHHQPKKDLLKQVVPNDLKRTSHLSTHRIYQGVHL